MAKETAPWFKFYPRDWRADEELRICSLAARGLWIEMLALMHTAKPYGHLLINGQPPTDAQIAVLTGCPAEQITALSGELEAAGVFSRTRAGTIYSRRMVRDEKRRLDGHKSAKEGRISGSSRPSQDTEILEEFPSPPRVPQGEPPPYPTPQRPDSQRADAEKEKTDVGAQTRSRPASRSDKPKRASRLDPDWTPSDSEQASASALGLTETDIRKIAPVFRDYWLAQAGSKGVKADWPATWRNWCRREADRLGRSPAAASPGAKYVPTEEQWRQHILFFRKTGGLFGGGKWPNELGPPPGEQGCKAPERLLKEAEAA